MIFAPWGQCYHISYVGTIRYECTKNGPYGFYNNKNYSSLGNFFIQKLFLIFKHFSVSRIKQFQIFKDMSIDQSEH